MTNLLGPNEMLQALAEDLGLSVKNLAGFTLECRAGRFPILKAEYLVKGVASLGRTIKRYELRPVLMKAYDE